MEITKYCYRCSNYESEACIKAGYKHDMLDIEPDCYKKRYCGTCPYAVSIDGKNEAVGCKKLNVLMSSHSKCQAEE